MTTEQFRATWCLLEDRRLLSLKPPIEMDPWALVLLVFGKRLLLLDQFEEDFLGLSVQYLYIQCFMCECSYMFRYFLTRDFGPQE